jgi:hypothetical protein
MNEDFYKRMFLIGAIWNILGGAFIVCYARWIFSIADLSVPEPPAYFDSWIALFVTFGIGYFMVFKDMYKNKNIVILGIIGKLSFSIIFIYNMVAYGGQIPLFFIIPVIGDLVFVVLFLKFLLFARKIGK